MMREEEGLRELRCVWGGGGGGCGGRMMDGDQGLGLIYGGKVGEIMGGDGGQSGEGCR